MLVICLSSKEDTHTAPRLWGPLDPATGAGLRCPLGPARSFYDTPAACISSVSPTARTRRSSCLCCSVERTPHFIGRSSVSPAPCALSSTCVKTRLHWRTIAVDSHRRSALTATGNSQGLTHVLQHCAQRRQPHHDGCSLSGVLTITILSRACWICSSVTRFADRPSCPLRFHSSHLLSWASCEPLGEQRGAFSEALSGQVRCRGR